MVLKKKNVNTDKTKWDAYVANWGLHLVFAFNDEEFAVAGDGLNSTFELKRFVSKGSSRSRRRKTYGCVLVKVDVHATSSSFQVRGFCASHIVEHEVTVFAKGVEFAFDFAFFEHVEFAQFEGAAVGGQVCFVSVHVVSDHGTGQSSHVEHVVEFGLAKFDETQVRFNVRFLDLALLETHSSGVYVYLHGVQDRNGQVVEFNLGPEKSTILSANNIVRFARAEVKT